MPAMVRTTPPRPVDIAAVVPGLAPLARTTVRLHPRPGEPTAADSSIGGPLLWPEGEPWPACAEWDGLGSWQPVEDAEAQHPPFPAPHEPTMLMIGRGYNLQLYACAANPTHQHVANMQ
jgi:hypothetical protein